MTTVSLKVPFLEYSSFTLAIEPVFVQVMFWTVLTPHFSPPLGAVTVREPTILKFASEMSTTVTSAVLVTRTLTVELILSGTVHAYVPAAASVDAVISEAVTKLSAEYSSLTLAIVPILVQVMFRFSPTIHVSPPFGTVRVTAPRILKFDPELAVTVASATFVIRTRTVAEIASGTVQP